MACRLIGAKPLSEAMLPYCQLGPKEYVSVKFYWKFIIFHSCESIKTIYICVCMHLKMLSVKWQPLCLVLNVLTPYNQIIFLYSALVRDDVVRDEVCQVSSLNPGHVGSTGELVSLGYPGNLPLASANCHLTVTVCAACQISVTFSQIQLAPCHTQPTVLGRCINGWVGVVSKRSLLLHAHNRYTIACP